MDYKVGNKVRIIDHCVEGMPAEMLADFGGKIMTISNVILYSRNNLAFYELKEDRFGWSWTPDMFEGIAYNSLPSRTNHTLPEI